VAPAALAGLLGSAVLAGAGSARAEVIEIDPGGDLIAAIAALSPGDELVLAGGTYNLNSLFTIAVSGAPGMPIVIRAKDGEIPIITRPDAAQNTINITGSYVTLRGLEVMGGSHGIRLNNCSFVTIEGCNVHSTGDVAISANVPGSSYQGLIFRKNHVHDTGGTGEAFYLGCNDDGCQMFDSVIEGNYVHDTVNGTQQGDGIEIKLGSYNNVVRDNVIHDTRYPCILVYGAAGHGGPNLIERNAMWGCGDHAIQAASDATIRNNIILGAAADGIRSQIHQGAEPQNLIIIHNTVINDGRDPRRRGGGLADRRQQRALQPEWQRAPRRRRSHRGGEPGQFRFGGGARGGRVRRRGQHRHRFRGRRFQRRPRGRVPGRGVGADRRRRRGARRHRRF